MPIIKSAIKRAKQNEQRRQRRQPYKSHMKTMIRKVQDAAQAGKTDEAKKLLPKTYKAIDTAAKKNLIHDKTAARRKAKVAKMAQQSA